MNQIIKKEVSGETSKPMIARRTKTVKIQRTDKATGKITATFDYAKVSARLAEFNSSHINGSIRTEYINESGMALFKAVIIPDVGNPERYFTGTSLGKIGSEKALEKLETIAVGRALAFAGYLSDGEIASREEMDKYEELPTIDNTGAIEKIKSAKNKEALRLIWLSLSQAEREDEQVFAIKEQMKESYETIQVGTEN